MAIVVGLIIIKSGYDIFKESAFSLSDGFPQEDLDNYRKIVLMVPGVRAVSDIRGRNYGANVYIDITILVDPEISVQAGHAITEKVESALQKTEDVTAIDVHVEPYQEN